MKFLERDLEDIIFSYGEALLQEGCVYMSKKRRRQVRIGNYGIADIVSLRRPYFHPFYKKMMKGTISIFELKQDKVTESSFFQAVRYVRGIQQYLYKNKPNLWDKFNYEIILIGRSICNDSCVSYLPSLFTFDTCDKDFNSEGVVNVSILKYGYCFNGISFERIEDFSKTDEGF